MTPRPRLAFALLIVAATACGLVYDVDSLEDSKCGQNDEPCCRVGNCAEGNVCVGGPKDGGADSGSCACKEAGSDAQSAACPCPTAKGVCQRCGYSGDPCCAREPGCEGITLKCVSGKCTGCGQVGEACCS